MPRLRELLAQVEVDAEVDLRRVESPDAAVTERFLGSPTVRVDGVDVEPAAAERDDFGLKCRLYRTEQGLQGTPPDALVLGAVRAAASRARGEN
ncbi:MAG TPA: hypothetical protein VMV16_06760 [Solirubrobacteraceae bacterium]|nr:hypothetical protein [Solirubrobacteraceae bacterium]